MIHGDNIKQYHGNLQLDFQVPRIANSLVRFPDIADFTVRHSDRCPQSVCSDQACETVPLNNSDHSSLQYNESGHRFNILQPVQEQPAEHQMPGSRSVQCSTTGFGQQHTDKYSAGRYA